MVAWESPGGVVMVLHRSEEEGSVLNVSIENEAVTISGENCQCACTTGEREKKGRKPNSLQKFGHFRLTVPLARCQITWKLDE